MLRTYLEFPSILQSNFNFLGADGSPFYVFKYSNGGSQRWCYFNYCSVHELWKGSVQDLR